jgi:hypothetical protein
MANAYSPIRTLLISSLYAHPYYVDDKGKPIARSGRKTMGLAQRDRQVAELGQSQDEAKARSALIIRPHASRFQAPAAF